MKLVFCRGLDGVSKAWGTFLGIPITTVIVGYSYCYYIGSYVGDPDSWKVWDNDQKHSLVARI